MAASLSEQVTALVGATRSLVAGVDEAVLEPATKKSVTGFKRQAADLRLDVRDYEFADSVQEQRKALRAAQKRLASLRTTMLVLSDAGLAGAADVAEYSARIDGVSAILHDD